MTENERMFGNKLYRYLMKLDYPATKEMMLFYLGWTKRKERQLRKLLSQIAQKLPVVSTSDSKGYFIAKSKDDLEAVEHQWAELSSRIEELEKRIKPLLEFREKYKGEKYKNE